MVDFKKLSFVQPWVFKRWFDDYDDMESLDVSCVYQWSQLAVKIELKIVYIVDGFKFVKEAYVFAPLKCVNFNKIKHMEIPYTPL